RCTAIYFGFLFGTLLYPLVTSLKKMSLPPKSILFAALILIGVDIFRGFFPIWTNTLTSRMVTGFILGVVSSFYVTPGVCDFALNLKQDE
ncbi:MAG: DUF2085 domain-containing protein, partial [candidate division KSB1 bacterium]|nr:DUF2085 domain-containing protein [candidate division KSB1 bacterium]